MKSMDDGGQDSGKNSPFSPFIHNHKTNFENLATLSAIFLKCVWRFRDIIHETVKDFPLTRLIHSWYTIMLNINSKGLFQRKFYRNH